MSFATTPVHGNNHSSLFVKWQYELKLCSAISFRLARLISYSERGTKIWVRVHKCCNISGSGIYIQAGFINTPLSPTFPVTPCTLISQLFRGSPRFNVKLWLVLLIWMVERLETPGADRRWQTQGFVEPSFVPLLATIHNHYRLPEQRSYRYIEGEFLFQ